MKTRNVFLAIYLLFILLVVFFLYYILFQLTFYFISGNINVFLNFILS